MQLNLFTQQTRQQWIDSGYVYVKITNSDDIYSDESKIEKYNLLEPYLNNENIADSDRVVRIASARIDKIMGSFRIRRPVA